jgi:hypothetical protein
MSRYLFAVSLLLFACGGSSGGSSGGDVGNFPDSLVTPDASKTPLVYGDPVPVDWQHSYGYFDSNAASRDKEAIVGLASAPDGTLYGLSDRRYGSDSDGDDLILLAVDPTGALSDKKLLRFDSGATVFGFARRPDGALLLALDFSGLTIIATNAAGEVAWSKPYDTEPYAFGGLGLHQMAFDDAGNIYFCGAYSPSTVGDPERGYVAKLDPSGEPLWMRSWAHDSFFERTRLAVSSEAVYVTDRLRGSDFADQIVVAFSTNGELVGQKYLTYTGFDGPRAAVDSSAVIADGAGATLIGTRATAIDGDHNLYVYRMDFDDKLGLVAHTGSKLPTESGIFAAALRLVPGEGGAIRAVTQLGLKGSYAVFDFTKANPVAAAYDIIREDATSPFLEDDDFPILIAPAPAGALYIAATSDVAGSITLRPRTSVALDLPLNLTDSKLTIINDTLVVEGLGDTFTVAAEEKGVLDDPQVDDEDAILLKATLP